MEHTTSSPLKKSSSSSLTKLLRNAKEGTPGKILFRSPALKVVKIRSDTDGSETDFSDGGLGPSVATTTPGRSSFAEHLSNLYEDHTFCDLTLAVGDVAKFKIHKVVLGMCSEKYIGIFTSQDAGSAQVTEIQLPAYLSPTAVEQVINFIYKKNADVNYDNVGDVLEVATQLDIKELQEHCQSLMKTGPADHLGRYLGLSRKLDLAGLRRELILAVAGNFREAANAKDFLVIDAEDLSSVLELNETHADGELVVFRAVMKWMASNNEGEKLTSAAAHILSHISFNSLEPEEVVTLEELPQFASIPEVKQMMLDVLGYHARTLFKQAKSMNFEVLDTSRQFLDNILWDSMTVVVVGGNCVENSKLTDNGSPFFVCQYAASKKWHLFPSLPLCLSFHCAVACQGSIYVMGGSTEGFSDVCSVQPTDRVFRFNVVEGCWSEVACMPHKRMMFAAVENGGLIYVIAGLGTGSSALDSVECYCPVSNQWSLLPPLPLPVVGPAACVSRGLIYVMGGYVPTFSRVFGASTVFIFNFDHCRWDSRCCMPKKLFFSSAVSEPSGTVFVVGGATRSEASESSGSSWDVFAYDPPSDTWSLVARLETARHGCGITLLDEKIFVYGGFNYSTSCALSSVESIGIHNYSVAFDSQNLPLHLIGFSLCSIAPRFGIN